MKTEIETAVTAAQEKKAVELVALDVSGVCSFTDCFVICSGANSRQVQAISDEIDAQLRKAGVHAHHIEGYTQAEWVLMDYLDFVVHIFSEKARAYYDLERLWKNARRLDL